MAILLAMARVDQSAMKLGRAPVRTDVRTLLLARYVTRAALPAAPSSADLSGGVEDWPMYGNDRLGDCTCAAAGHMVQAWSAEAGKEETVGEAAVIALFDAVKIRDERSGEFGAVELDVLNRWRAAGLAGHRIGAFAKVPVFDPAMVRVGAYVFGGLYIGLELPASAQEQDVWDWNGDLAGADAPGSWGGHAVNVVGYDEDGLTVVTWGAPKRMTWSFWERYCDEAYCAISRDFLGGGPPRSPEGLDMRSLEADLRLLEADA